MIDTLIEQGMRLQARIDELENAIRNHKLQFVWAIVPALGKSDEEQNRIYRKVHETLWSIIDEENSTQTESETDS